VVPGNGKALGLDEMGLQYRQTGGQTARFLRNVGKNTPLKLERGLNALWTKGGLMYSPPFK
jgi:general L-amino acid transport system substrate-binding protein